MNDSINIKHRKALLTLEEKPNLFLKIWLQGLIFQNINCKSRVLEVQIFTAYVLIVNNKQNKQTYMRSTNQKLMSFGDTLLFQSLGSVYTKILSRIIKRLVPILDSDWSIAVLYSW